jgi:hypothetical protein
VRPKQIVVTDVGWHPSHALPKPGDLIMELDGVGPGQPTGGKVERPRIDIQEFANRHDAILPEGAGREQGSASRGGPGPLQRRVRRSGSSPGAQRPGDVEARSRCSPQRSPAVDSLSPLG